jgi:translation elongation factor EF-G
MIFINKIDKEGANINSVLADLKSTLSKNCVIIESLEDPVLMEAIAESDDSLLEKYLAVLRLSVDEIKGGLANAVAKRKLFPVIVGSALTDKGILGLLEDIIQYLPSPLGRNTVLAANPLKPEEKKEVVFKDDAPFSGFVFKNISDPYVGQLNLMRIFSGTLTSNSSFYNATKRTKERIGQIHILQGKEGQDNQGFHLQKGAIGYFDEIIGIDGCIMITTGKFIKEGLRFDDQTYTGNDFYDLDLCLNVSQMGYKIAVADILIYHASTGRGVFTDDWKNAKDIFLKKWTDKGFNFPLTRSQFPYKKIESEIVEISL